MVKGGKKPLTPKKKGNGYKMPPPIPPGEVIHYRNRKWKIGPSIGVGGFGEIYSACELKDGESTSNDASDYPYVVKIEPMENGPLFVEMHFYNRNGDGNDIEQFMNSRNLSQLGMPVYCGSGSHKFQNKELRFLILERYGTDLWKIFNQVGRKFPVASVFQIGLQMLDVLDYIHSRSYIHADIKGANILLGIKEGTENQAYLLDFGLAYRIVDDNYRPDPKNAHEGTIEYTSTDRHIGAKTMRGDLEILAYNLLHWLVGELPWEKVLQDPKRVHEMKTDLMNDVRTRITTDYPNVPGELIKFFEYIKTLEPKDIPDYTICRGIFESYLTSVGKTRTSKLEFTTTNNNDEPIPLSLNGDNSKPTENAEIGSKNTLKDIKTNKKIKPTVEIDTPSTQPNSITPLENIPFSENDSQNELNEKRDRIVTKNKKNKKKTEDEITVLKPVKDDHESDQLDDIQEQKVMKNKKNKNKTDKDTEVTDSPENDIESVQLDDKKEQTVAKTKKTKKKKDENSEDTPLVLEDAESKQTDDSQEQKVKKTKKNKKKTDENPEDTPPVENDVESEQTADNQGQKVTKAKKNKNKTDENPEETPPVEKDVESEQTADNQGQKVTKTKKNKKKTDENPEEIPPVENDVESEQTADNQGRKITKTKKNKKKTDENPEETPPVENDVESEQTADNQGQKVTKTKKNKKKTDENPEDTPPVENDVESEQTADNQEYKVTKTEKNKTKRDKNSEGTKPIEKGSENEQADDSQEQKVHKKNKKKKDKKTEDIQPAVNDAKSEQVDDNQEQEVTTTKRKKRKTVENIEDAPLAEEDVASEKPDEDEFEEVTKKKRTKIDKKSEDTSSADDHIKNEQPDDNQEQEVTKLKKNKKKKKKEHEVENGTELDYQEQPAKKIKKSSTPTTPKEKKKKKPKAKTYTESDSESDFLDTIQKKKQNRIKADTKSHLDRPKLPLKNVDGDVDKTNSDTGIPRRALRSKGKKTRYCYADLC